MRLGFDRIETEFEKPKAEFGRNEIGFDRNLTVIRLGSISLDKNDTGFVMT